MIPFTPAAVFKCFGTVAADVQKMNSTKVNTWFKSTFPEIFSVVSQNSSLFPVALANSNIIAIPTEPIIGRKNRSYDDRRGDSKEVAFYNSTIAKIKVAFGIDLRSAMTCAGYSPEQIQKAIVAFDKLFPRVIDK